MSSDSDNDNERDNDNELPPKDAIPAVPDGAAASPPLSAPPRTVRSVPPPLPARARSVPPPPVVPPPAAIPAELESTPNVTDEEPHPISSRLMAAQHAPIQEITQPIIMPPVHVQPQIQEITAPLPPMPAPFPVAVPNEGPYRTPDNPNAIEHVPLGGPFATPKKARPILGGAVWTYGALLWAFVIFGQFTTSWGLSTPLNQTAAIVIVLIIMSIAWIKSLRHGSIAAPGNIAGRALGILMLSFTFFGVTWVLSIIGGAMTGKMSGLVPFCLVGVALLSVIFGARMTSPIKLERSHGQRFASVVMWILGTILTLVAGADLASNG